VLHAFFSCCESRDADRNVRDDVDDPCCPSRMVWRGSVSSPGGAIGSDEFFARLSEQGVSTARYERWRGQRLIPGPVSGAGRGRGEGRDFRYDADTIPQIKRCQVLIDQYGMNLEEVAVQLFREHRGIEVKRVSNAIRWLCLHSKQAVIVEPTPSQLSELSMDIASSRSNEPDQKFARGRIRDLDAFERLLEYILHRGFLNSSPLSVVPEVVTSAAEKTFLIPASSAEASLPVSKDWNQVARKNLPAAFKFVRGFVLGLPNALSANEASIRKACDDAEMFMRLAILERVASADGKRHGFQVGPLLEQYNNPRGFARIVVYFRHFRNVGFDENIDAVLNAIAANTEEVVCHNKNISPRDC